MCGDSALGCVALRDRMTLATFERWMAIRKELREPWGASGSGLGLAGGLCSVPDTLCSGAGCKSCGGMPVGTVAVMLGAVHCWAGGPRVGGGGCGRSAGVAAGVAATLCSGGGVARIVAKGLKTRAISVKDSTAEAVAAAKGVRSSTGMCVDDDSVLSVAVRSDS